MDSRNKYAWIIIVLLITTLSILYFSFTPDLVEEQNLEPYGEVDFVEENYYIYVNHTFEIRNAENGDWYFDGNKTVLQDYRIITEFNITINEDFANFTDNQLDTESYFTLNITLSLYDQNKGNYTLYDDPLIYKSIDLKAMYFDAIYNGDNYTITGSYVSKWFTPVEFDDSYRLNYIFSSQYKFLIMSNEGVEYFESDVYLLPSEFYLRYNNSQIVPLWWYWIAGIIGIGSVLIGYLHKHGKLDRTKSQKNKPIKKVGKNPPKNQRKTFKY